MIVNNKNYEALDVSIYYTVVTVVCRVVTVVARRALHVDIALWAYDKYPRNHVSDACT